MKTKVCLGLSVCCLMFAVGGLVMTHVEAQIHTKLPWPPTNVVFEEDPLRQHALQVQSFYKYVDTSTYTDILTVPIDKRFVITDVISDGGTGATHVLGLHDSSGQKAAFIVRWDTVGEQTNFSVQSGITFEPGDNVKIGISNAFAYVTISGYYVDL